jgi:hypothetical protein
MKIDPATIKVPDASALAAHDVFWDARFKGEPIDLDLEFDRLFHYAVAAAIAAWPEAELDDYPEMPHIILPLQEQADE